MPLTGIRSQHPVYKYVTEIPTNRSPNSSARTVKCDWCWNTFSGTCYRFVGHFLQEHGNRGIGICPKAHLFPQEIADIRAFDCGNSVSHSSSRKRLLGTTTSSPNIIDLDGPSPTPIVQPRWKQLRFASSSTALNSSQMEEYTAGVLFKTYRIYLCRCVSFQSVKFSLLPRVH
ncbi:hypothetical protein GEMRC1_002903 [Eukaryota sp. GEM-RC1]